MPGDTQRLPKKTTPLKLKLAERAVHEARLAEALRLHRAAERARGRPKRGRPDAESLAAYLVVPADSDRTLRPASGFRSRTYADARRLREFVDHLFVRYPVPTFLYRAVLKPEGFSLLVPDARPERRPAAWAQDAFFAAAQGRSVADLLQGQLNRREAHWLLRAPETVRLCDALRWAIVAATGMPRAQAGPVFHWLGLGLTGLSTLPRLREAAGFFAREWPNMDEDTLYSILGFLPSAYDDPSFSLAGRTVRSLAEMADLWRVTDLKGGRIPFRAWAPALPPWELRCGGQTVRAVEITNSRALAEEGRRQRHCVYMHLDECLERHSAVVSLRWFGTAGDGRTTITKRLTVEVRLRNRVVNQATLANNRPPDEAERRLLGRWAEEHRLTIGAVV